MVAQDTRRLLINAAKTLFAKQGYDGTSVKDICDAAGVNVSLVSYHFDGKEGLFRACLEEFGRSRLEAHQRILSGTIRSKEELRVRLEMFVTDLFQAHLDEPDLAQIVHREVALRQNCVEDVFRGTFIKAFTEIVQFLAEAQKTGFLKNQLDPLIMASFLFGAMLHTAQKAEVGKKFFGKSILDADQRLKIVEQFVSIFLEGVISRENAELT